MHKSTIFLIIDITNNNKMSGNLIFTQNVHILFYINLLGLLGRIKSNIIERKVILCIIIIRINDTLYKNSRP